MKNHRCLTAALVAAAAFAAPLLTAPAQAADKVVLMINWYVYGEHAPFYYGKEKGIFAAEGIDLDIQEGRGSAVTVQAVAAKTVPFGYADVPTMIRAAVKGAPVVAAGVALQKNPMSVMGFAEKNIRKPEDIKGKIVATTPGDSMSQIWPLFLKKTGLKESEFRIVSGDAQTKLNGVISHKDTLKDNADLVRRFMSAATKSIEAAEKDPSGAADAILKINPKGGKKETLQEGFELTIPLYRTEETKTLRPFNVSDANMKDSVALLVEYGGVNASANSDPKAFYTRDFLPKSAGH